MRRTDSLEKTVMLGKFEGRRRRGQQRMRWLDSITHSMDMNMSKLWETAEDRGAWRAVVHRVAKSRNDLATEQWQQIVCGCLSASVTRWCGCDRDPREGKDSDIYSLAFHRKRLTITGQKVYHRSSQNLLPVRIAWGALKNALSMSHPGMIKWEPLGVGSKHKIFFLIFQGIPTCRQIWEAVG